MCNNSADVQEFSIFLSHITVESKLADLLRKRSVRDFMGLVEVFVSSDRLSIPAGTKWLDEVIGALRRAHLHLILCSQGATTRPWIQFEAEAAPLRGVPTSMPQRFDLCAITGSTE
jgi:hypothetical protein